MSQHVLIIDTSVLCCFLKVPGKAEAGPLEDRWTYERIKKIFDEGSAAGSTFVLPTATLIETGNHIAQAPSERFEIAKELAEIIRSASQARTPWAAFTDQATLWENEKLQTLCDTWPDLAATKLTIGDASIKNVAEHYAQMGMTVEIVTGDAGLKAYQPATPPLVPRRRQKL